MFFTELLELPFFLSQRTEGTRAKVQRCTPMDEWKGIMWNKSSMPYGSTNPITFWEWFHGTQIPYWGGDYTPQSSSEKVVGSLGMMYYSRCFFCFCCHSFLKKMSKSKSWEIAGKMLRVNLKASSKLQGSYNTPLRHTPGSPLSQPWKDSLYSVLVKVFRWNNHLA